MMLANLWTSFAATHTRARRAPQHPAAAPECDVQAREWSKDPHLPAPAARFSRILCLVEFSESGYSAVHYADSLALRFGAALTLLHVAPAEQVRLAMARPGADRQLNFRGGRRRALRIAEASRPGESPVGEIVRTVSQEGHDLIVLPARPAGVIRRRLPLRTIPAAVLARTRCPVIAGANFGRPAHGGPILCAVDRLPGSRRLLEFASSFARAVEAPLALVHAAGDLPERRIYDEEWNLTPKGRIHDELFAMQQECGAVSEIFVEPGAPGEALARIAARTKASLVIARRPVPGGPLARFRVPEPDLLRSSPCPMLHL